jgi:hypothetical protein
MAEEQRGYLLGGKALKQIQRLINENLRLYQNETPPKGRFNASQRPITVILDAALDVATDSKTGATSCLATRLAYSVTDNEYSETDQQVTVWNHSESDSYEIDTFGKAEWIDGHWWFFGDCGPMAAR